MCTRLSRRLTLLPSLSEYSDEEELDKEKERGKEEEEEEGEGEVLDDTLNEKRDDSRGGVRKKLSLLANQMMYFLTEREQFKPPKQKQK